MATLAANKNKSHLYSLDLIKAIGIVLVINSHLDVIYGDPLIATGGALGNSLFFLASGVGLGYGWAHRGREKFVSWYKRRLVRIYPSLTLINVIATLIAFVVTKQPPQEIFGFFVYPTAYFFIAAILLFYIPGYFLLWMQSTKAILLALLISAVIYAIWYAQLDLSVFNIEGGSFFRWIFYFMVFALGLLYARIKTFKGTADLAAQRLVGFFSALSVHRFPALACSLGLFAFSKFLFRGSSPAVMNFQFLVQIFTLALTWYVFMASEFVAARLHANRYAWPVISLLSAITLELYLLDRYVDPYVNASDAIIASLNLILPLEIKSRFLAVILLWFFLVALAVGLSRCSGFLAGLFRSPKPIQA
ncbi:MAG: acyltransferase family protein [Cyanobacteriota bacterium]|nr:acyltransferase family protein [Cyanobacteriota bacterium]